MLDSILSGSLTAGTYLLCTGASLALGILGALVYMYKNTYSKGFAVTLCLLPAVVQLVILLVNGNIGAGVAVAGAFSLVRFRSAPGTAREILAIFCAMAVGLATGMGYLLVAALFLLVIGLATLALVSTHFGEASAQEKQLKITIPENLDYAGLFDAEFAAFTARAELVRVKTTNLGSLFELQYRIRLKNEMEEKRFLDALRVKNGNLNITCGRMPSGKEEL